MNIAICNLLNAITTQLWKALFTKLSCKGHDLIYFGREFSLCQILLVLDALLLLLLCMLVSDDEIVLDKICVIFRLNTR